MKLILDPKYQEKIKSIISKNLPGIKGWYFGSRTKGTARKFSDVDLALDIHAPYNIRDIWKLRELFDDSDLPYVIDVADFNSFSDEFRSSIAPELIEI